MSEQRSSKISLLAFDVAYSGYLISVVASFVASNGVHRGPILSTVNSSTCTDGPGERADSGVGRTRNA